MSTVYYKEDEHVPAGGQNLDDLDIVDSFDYVFVFPVVVEKTAREKLADKMSGVDEQLWLDKKEQLQKNPQGAPHIKFIQNSLAKAGLETFSYLSVQRDEVITLVKATEQKLMRFADQEDVKLELEPTAVQKAMEAGVQETYTDTTTGQEVSTGKWLIAPVVIPHEEKITPIPPYKFLYGKFEEDEAFRTLYKRHLGRNGTSSIFSRNTRLKVVMNIIEAPRRHGGAGLEVRKLIHHKRIKAMFPMHDVKERDALLEKVMRKGSAPWSHSTFEIKEYFGEKIGLYIAFTGHYSYSIISPAIVGTIMQLIVWANNNDTGNSPVLPFFSVFMVAWGIVMLETWKQQESRIALAWGMTEFESKEPVRPEHTGEMIKSVVDGTDTIYYPPAEARGRSFISSLIVGAFLLLIVGVVACIYVMRFSLQSQLNEWASILASVLNTVQITIFNLIYQGSAIYLTDAENHRTDTAYEDSMTTKLFVFQFINSFASFFFLAFIAQNIDGPSGTNSSYRGSCGATTCMKPLEFNLLIIFGTRLTLTNFLDIFLPYIATQQKIKEETEDVEDADLSPPEQDYMLSHYDTVVEGIKSYADLGIQYGFAMLFITALPIASLFCLVSNHVKIKFVIWKLLRLYQRPVPSGAQDIGNWQGIFLVVTNLAVVTNAGLVCFTMTVLPDHYTLQAKMWIFLGFQWVMFSIQILIMYFVDDIPHDVSIQHERMEFITSKVIDRLPDEDSLPVNQKIEEVDMKRGSIGHGLEDLGEFAKHKALQCLCFAFRRRKPDDMGRLDGSSYTDLNIQPYPTDKGGEQRNPLVRQISSTKPSTAALGLVGIAAVNKPPPPPPPPTGGESV